MRNTPYNILSKPDTGSQTGPAQFVGQAYAASFVATFGDTDAAGTIQIQGSNDSPVGPGAQFVPTNWANIPNATITVTAGAGPALVLPVTPFQYIRAVFTSSNAGSTTINVNATFMYT